MCWDSDVNYVRLTDFAEALEEIGPGDRIESPGSELCQEGTWDGCFVGIEHPVAWTGVRISKRSLDPTRSKIIPIDTSTKESTN